MTLVYKDNRTYTSAQCKHNISFILTQELANTKVIVESEKKLLCCDLHIILNYKQVNPLPNPFFLMSGFPCFNLILYFLHAMWWCNFDDNQVFR